MGIIARLTPPQSRPTTEKDGEEFRSATRARHEVDGYELSAISYNLPALATKWTGIRYEQPTALPGVKW